MTSIRQGYFALAAGAGIAAMAAPGALLAAEAGDWIVRGSIANVAPNEDTGSASGQLAGALSGADVEVDAQTTLGVTGAYFVTDRIAVELLASAPFEHDLSIDGGALNATRNDNVFGPVQ